MTFDQLVKHFGTQQAAATALGVSQPAISNWGKRGRIPDAAQLKASVISKGKLKISKGILPAQKRK